LPEDGYEAFLSVPIIVPSDRVIGVINVQHRHVHWHSEREQTLLSIIGHHALDEPVEKSALSHRQSPIWNILLRHPYR
jgi:signal transduction protein with GAF and PtsI domain